MLLYCFVRSAREVCKTQASGLVLHQPKSSPMKRRTLVDASVRPREPALVGLRKPTHAPRVPDRR